MTLKSRRNSAHKRAPSCPPYNEIWQSFYSILGPIFADRLSEGKRSSYYVQIPAVEQDITDYIASDSNRVAILHGLMGAGKSTILEHFASNRKSASKNHTIYLDFQGRRHHLVPHEDYLSLSRADRRQAARIMVTKRLNELLLSFVSENSSYINTNFFDFLKANFPSEIGAKAIFASSEDEKNSILRDFMSDVDKTAAVQCFMLYMAVTRGYDDFVLVIDNVDEQSFEVVEGLFFALSDLLDCLLRPRRRSLTRSSNPSDAEESAAGFHHSVRFRAILACRSYTFEALRNDQEGILPTRGYEEIELKSGSLLTYIIRKRIQAVRSQSARQDSLYTLKSGMNVHISDALTFIDIFVSRLAQVSVESELFDLFNHNHARALQNIKYVIQNRYFVSYDANILSRGELKPDFHYVRVLKALSYGNPTDEEQLYYPSRSSIVPNLLYWDPDDEQTFFLALRLCKWIANSIDSDNFGHISVEGIKIKDCIAEFETKFGVPTSAVLWALRYLHENGLIFAESGYRSALSSSESVCLSPRGRMALKEIFREIAMLEIIIDDVSVPEWRRSLLEGRLSVVQLDKYPTRFHFQDTMNWLRMFLDFERRGLESFRHKHLRSPRDIISIFDGGLISGHLGAAMKESFGKYYKNVCSKKDKSEIATYIKLCDDAFEFYTQ
jgi:hypothetical protein